MLGLTGGQVNMDSVGPETYVEYIYLLESMTALPPSGIAGSCAAHRVRVAVATAAGMLGRPA